MKSLFGRFIYLLLSSTTGRLSLINYLSTRGIHDYKVRRDSDGQIVAFYFGDWSNLK